MDEVKTRPGDSDLATEIVRYRARHGLNQEEFGKLCGLTRQTIMLIENGRRGRPGAGIARTTREKIRMIIEEG